MPVTSPHKSSPATQTDSAPLESEGARGLIAWSSLFFAVLQSICTFFAATAGLRLLIGAGSLVLSAGTVSFLTRLHADWLRVPMILLALIGALINLAVIRRLRRLRDRPASQWRQAPVSAHKLRMERLELFLAWATLVLIAAEETLHIHFTHGL